MKERVPFNEIIGSRDDIICYLLNAGLDCSFACRIVDEIEMEEGLDRKCISALTQNGIPEWFIHSCNKILGDLPSKAHSASTDALPALKAAWYKAHFPDEYAQAYSKLYVD